MSYEAWIAKRYLWSKRRHPFVGVISVISILGISVGVAALVVVLAVMNGFDEDLKSRIIGTRAHLIVEKDGLFDDAPAVMERLKSVPSVAGAAPYVEGQALIQSDGAGSGVLVRGVEVNEERRVSKFFNYVTQGTLTEKPNGVVVGCELARRFGLRLGSQFQILSQDKAKPLPYTVEGIFTSGMYDYDANLVFLNLRSAQELFLLKNNVSGVSVYLKDSGGAARAKRMIQKELGYPYFVHSWMDLNKTLFGALRLEKTVMFLILALIILVASLNIAGSLTILVTDKTKDIGVLKALGALPSSLVKIFAACGLLVGLTGAGTGLAIGAGICWSIQRFKWVELPKEIYYFDRLPVQMNAADLFSIFLVAVGLSFLSALYPAFTAGRLNPVKALRYE